MPNSKSKPSPSKSTSITTLAKASSTSTDTNNTAVFIEGDYLNKDIEKELGALGIHTAESNPDTWEEELKRELSELDATNKEGANGLLSQNWEEELMLELGLKDKDPLLTAVSNSSSDTLTDSTTAFEDPTLQASNGTNIATNTTPTDLMTSTTIVSQASTDIPATTDTDQPTSLTDLQPDSVPTSTEPQEPNSDTAVP